MDLRPMETVEGKPKPGLRKVGQLLAIVGAIGLLVPVVRLAQFALAMVNAFNTAAEAGTVEDSANTRVAVEDMFNSLFPSLLANLAGAILVFIAALGCRYRASWMFQILLIGLVFGFPGLISIPLLIFVVWRRDLFQTPVGV